MEWRLNDPNSGSHTASLTWRREAVLGQQEPKSPGRLPGVGLIAYPMQGIPSPHRGRYVDGGTARNSEREGYCRWSGYARTAARQS